MTEGYVYLVQNTKIWASDVFKVGKTSDWQARQRAYGNIPAIILFKVSECSSLERKIIAEFSAKFDLVQGKEFFKCSKKEAVDTFLRCLTEWNNRGEGNNSRTSFEKQEPPPIRENIEDSARPCCTEKECDACSTVPSAEIVCLCGTVPPYNNKVEEHLKEHIEGGEIDGRFFCTACNYESRNIYNFLGHCEKRYHKARRCFIHFMTLTGNIQEAYCMTKYLTEISDEKLYSLRLEMKIRFGVVEGTPEENEKAREMFLIK